MIIEQKLRKNFYNDLEKLVSIESVLSSPRLNKPFGEQIDKVLDETLNICEEIGFKVHKDVDGFYGFAEIGTGPELIGILCHLDVVGVGDPTKWDGNPCSLNFKEGKVIGRGVLDNKGPTVACIHAIKLLIEEKIRFKRRYRIIFGLSEETTWKCIKRYKLQEELPIFAFVPDSKFPVTTVEKGLVRFDVISRTDLNLDLEVGTAYNVIPDESCLHLEGIRKDDLRLLLDDIHKYRIKYEFLGDKIFLYGLSAHASRPELAINVASYTLNLLSKLGYKGAIIDFFNEKIGFDLHGESLFGKVLGNKKTGPLTVTLTKIKFTKNKVQILSFDMRIPVGFVKEELVSRLKTVLKAYCLDYYEILASNPLELSSKSKFITLLVDAYREISKDISSMPQSSAALTYARALKNCVAFGPCIPSTNRSSVHQVNEYMFEKELLNLILIYKHALKKINYQ